MDKEAVTSIVIQQLGETDTIAFGSNNKNLPITLSSFAEEMLVTATNCRPYIL
jgi:hypothetical protein